MTGLLGPDGNPISNKKASAPSQGEKFGVWGGPDAEWSVMSLPGGGALSFNLDQLTLLDYRQMKDHYQINNSLVVLSFLMHQLDWRIECDDAKQRDFYVEQIENNWTRLVWSMSQAFWAGYSPNVIQWDNDTEGRRIVIDKIKDLTPESCEVKWKQVDGYTSNNQTHKINIYNGIRQWGSPAIPVENSFWYPLLMEGGNMYGKKLLRSAFQPWFFSMLVHLFANRYYERFGEPTPVGRAPYDDTVIMDGKTMQGNQAMELILRSLRNRSTVVLPADRTPVGDETNPEFDYQIDYLESQMRGADFERYMTRLDEEMSLALFTPILMMRTADVGSYNLGTQHTITYQWLLNALSGDWRYYVDWYLLRPMRDFNFGTNASLPRIKFRRMGAHNEEMVKNIVSAMVAAGTAGVDLDQVGEIAGLDLKKVQILKTGEDPDADPDGTDPGGDNKATTNALRSVAEKIRERVNDQVLSAFRDKKLRNKRDWSIGFTSKYRDALIEMGYVRSDDLTREFVGSMESTLIDLSEKLPHDPIQFMKEFTTEMFTHIYTLGDAA